MPDWTPTGVALDVLKAIAVLRRDAHSAGIVVWLSAERTLSRSRIHPILRRLEYNGYVEVAERQKVNHGGLFRHVYRLTEKGRSLLEGQPPK